MTHVDAGDKRSAEVSFAAKVSRRGRLGNSSDHHTMGLRLRVTGEEVRKGRWFPVIRLRTWRLLELLELLRRTGMLLQRHGKFLQGENMDMKDLAHKEWEEPTVTAAA